MVDTTSRILLVDDRETNLDLFSRRLRRKGYEVFEALSGEEALRIVENEPLDLVLLDVMMPGMSGIEVLGVIRQSRSLSDLPVIMVTARSGSEDVVAALKAGANDYLPKPVDFPVAFARIDTQLKLKHAEDALKVANEMLEIRVDERTAEVRAANDQLHQEIKERVQAEGEVRVERERLEGLLQNLPDAVCMLDERCVPVVTNRLGVKFIGKLGHVDLQAPLLRLQETPIAELLLSRPDGLPHAFETDDGSYELRAASLLDRGDLRGYVLVIRDVTEERKARKRIEEQYRLASIGQVAAGIAHDFNNLLTVMTGFAQIMELRKDISEDQRSELRNITTQGQSAAQLIRRILDFARQRDVERFGMDLVSFLNEATDLLKRVLPETMSLEAEASTESLLVVANAGQLQEVIHNLVINSRDAMEGDGAVRIRLDVWELPHGRPAPVPLMSPGSYALIEVSDTGPGMDDRVQARIYEPFFSTKDPEKGTGLGLAQSYGIVTQHGGFIDCESRLGEGTTFRIYLPIAQGMAVEETTKSKIPRGDGQRILVVEDKPEVLNAILSMVGSLNYEVQGAANGVEALRHLSGSTDSTSLVLTDLMMPEMSGAELVDQITLTHPHIPIVLVTGYDVEDETFKQIQEKTRATVLKPLKLKELAVVIDQCLRTRSAEGEKRG